MTWFYNSHSGNLVNESPPSPGYFLYEADLHAGLGWHAYATEAEADAAAKANGWPGPYLNDQGNPAGGEAQAGSAIGGTAAAAVKSALGSGYQLVFGNTTGLLGRVLKVIIGGVLILSGIIHLSGADKSALGVAGKVVLPV